MVSVKLKDKKKKKKKSKSDDNMIGLFAYIEITIR